MDSYYKDFIIIARKAIMADVMQFSQITHDSFQITLNMAFNFTLKANLQSLMCHILRLCRNQHVCVELKQPYGPQV